MESLYNGVKTVIPFFMPVIVAGIIEMIIKSFITRNIYHLSLLCGNGKRKARRDAKTAGDIIDMASAINDIKGIKK